MAVLGKLLSLSQRRAILAAIILYISVKIYKHRATKHKSVPNAEGFIPILGHLIAITKMFNEKKVHEWEIKEFTNQGKNGPGIYCAHMFGARKHRLFIGNPKVLGIIWRDNFLIAERGDVFDTLHELLGNGIFSGESNGEIWKKQRKIASSMFTMRSLKNYMFDIFIDTTHVLINKINELSVNNKPIDIYDMFGRLTFEAFTKIAFGEDVNAINAAPKRILFEEYFDRGFALAQARTVDPFWKFRKKYVNFIGLEKEMKDVKKYLHAYVKNIVDKRKEYYENNIKNMDKHDKKINKNKFDLLSMFIERYKENISDDFLRDITMNFIIAGRDTTSQMLSWFMFHLYNELDMEKRNIIVNNIKNEINNIFNCCNKNMKLDYNKVNQCKYIEACLKETLRLYPSVPHFVRELVKDFDIKLNGKIYHLKKCDELVICNVALGRLPWLWEKADEFIPERFIHKTYDASVYPAFNINPRTCLGKNVGLLEGKIAIILLYSYFKDFKAVPGQSYGYIPAATHQLKEGFKIYIQ